jgi:hypothetical protein
MGIRSASELGISKVIVETNSMLLKMALESNTFSLTPTGGIVFEIKSLMNMYFNVCSFSFYHRECNRVVRAIAPQGCKCPHETAFDGMARLWVRGPSVLHHPPLQPQIYPP